MVYEIEVIRGTHVFGATADTSSVDISASGLPSLDKCAYNHTGMHRLSMGPTASSNVDQSDLDLLFSSYLSDPSTISINRSPNGDDVDHDVNWECWFYNGAEGGDNSFVVHEVDTTIPGGSVSSTTTVTSIGDISKCVPYIIAQDTNSTIQYTQMYRVQARVELSGTNTLVCDRANTFNTASLKVGIIEFSGANWTVQKLSHTMSGAGTVEFPNLTTPVASWDNAFILYSFHPPDGQIGLSETSILAHPTVVTSAMGFYLYTGADSPATGYVVTAYIVENPDITVHHSYSTSGSTISLSLNTVDVTIPTVDPTRTGTFGSVVCNGTGAAYARQVGHTKLVDSTTLRVERRRDGQAWHYAMQAIEFPNTQVITSRPRVQSVVIM